MKKLIIWDKTTYSTVEEALQDGATTVIKQPNHLNYDSFLAGVNQAVTAAGNRFAGNQDMLEVSVMPDHKTFRVEVEVLEWNKYSLSVNASSKEEAERYVMAEGVLSLSRSDCETGSSAYEDSSSTDDRLIDGTDTVGYYPSVENVVPEGYFADDGIKDIDLLEGESIHGKGLYFRYTKTIDGEVVGLGVEPTINDCIARIKSLRNVYA
ncbi:hypothetical protein VPHK449_0024 [Vibrio phage K449]